MREAQIESQSEVPYSYTCTELLREIHFGIREGHLKTLTVQQVKEIISKERNINHEDIVDSAETWTDVHRRQRDFLALIHENLLNNINKPEDGTETAVPRILCLSHGGFIRDFLSNYTGVKVHSIGNCSITVLRTTWSSSSEISSCVGLDVNNMNYSDAGYIWPSSLSIQTGVV